MVGVQGLSRRRRLHPARGEHAGVGSPTVLTKPPGRARGKGGRYSKALILGVMVL